MSKADETINPEEQEQDTGILYVGIDLGTSRTAIIARAGINLSSVYCGDAGWLPVFHRNNSILLPVCVTSSTSIM